MHRKTKYYDVVCIKVGFVNNFNISFDCCSDAAEWMHTYGISASVNAARVGMSGVLTGRHAYYRGMTVNAERNY